MIASLLGSLLFLDATIGQQKNELLQKLCQEAKVAIEKNRLARTELAGKEGGVFEDLPRNGCILVGFRLGIGKFASNPVVHTIQPIFLTSKGEAVYGKVRGEERVKSGRRSRKNVEETKIIRARPGYAVCSITLKAGLQLDGISCEYARMKEGGLDVEDKYQSDWIGGNGGGQSQTVNSDGQPCYGIRGTVERNNCVALGLVSARLKMPDDDEPAADEDPKKKKSAGESKSK